MKYNYRTSGVCSRQISFNIDGDKISNISFVGGCDGNLQAVSKLCDGKTVDEIESTLGGIRCGYKATSCGDQLAKAVRQAYDSLN